MATQKLVRKISRDYVDRLARDIVVDNALLTGSWARGSYLEDSDVDLIIVWDDFEQICLPERLAYLQKSWKNRLPLEAFGYTTREFTRLKRNSTYVRDAVQHGISLTTKKGRGWPRTKRKITS